MNHRCHHVTNLSCIPLLSHVILNNCKSPIMKVGWFRIKCSRIHLNLSPWSSLSDMLYSLIVIRRQIFNEEVSNLLPCRAEWIVHPPEHLRRLQFSVILWQISQLVATRGSGLGWVDFWVLQNWRFLHIMFLIPVYFALGWLWAEALIPLTLAKSVKYELVLTILIVDGAE